jgi:hypothetical protein
VDFDATTEFWTATKTIASYLASAAGKQRALETMGTLAYIPDPPVDEVKSDSTAPTGWEEFFVGRFGKDTSSIGMSNMGAMALPKGATDLIWSQESSPMGPALEACVVSHEGGLRVSLVWREGSVLRRGEVARIAGEWQRVLKDV